MPLEVPPPPPSPPPNEDDPPSPRPPMQEMMESQVSLKLNNDVLSTSSDTTLSLEQRVAELELKLATLSRLLQQAQRGNTATNNVSQYHTVRMIHVVVMLVYSLSL